MLTAVAGKKRIPQGVSPQDTFSQVEGVPSASRRVKGGTALFHVGDEFSSIYFVRFGSFKTFAGDSEGRHQVTGFSLPGDVLGLDGIASGRRTVTAVALEDSEVMVLPFVALERAALHDRTLQHRLHALMSGQIVHDHGVMMMLSAMCAGERVAAFLLNLSRRYQRLGYSPGEFHLRMTRADIGSYLGLKLETVSRTMAMLAESGLIEVHQKHIRLVDLAGLDRMRGNAKQATEQARTQKLAEQAGMVQADARNTLQRSATARSLSALMRRQRKQGL
jgi:CRP/FNR family transcriptional regulator